MFLIKILYNLYYIQHKILNIETKKKKHIYKQLYTGVKTTSVRNSIWSRSSLSFEITFYFLSDYLTFVTHKHFWQILAEMFVIKVKLIVKETLKSSALREFREQFARYIWNTIHIIIARCVCVCVCVWVLSKQTYPSEVVPHEVIDHGGCHTAAAKRATIHLVRRPFNPACLARRTVD